MTFPPYTETHTKLSLALHLAYLTIALRSWFLLTSKQNSNSKSIFTFTISLTGGIRVKCFAQGHIDRLFTLGIQTNNLAITGPTLLAARLPAAQSGSGQMLQDCFSSTDWHTFWDSSDGIEEITTSVTDFINKCINDVVPTVTMSCPLGEWRIHGVG
jgi:hypothetical protein